MVHSESKFRAAWGWWIHEAAEAEAGTMEGGPMQGDATVTGSGEGE